jgi:hypothetical protein
VILSIDSLRSMLFGKKMSDNICIHYLHVSLKCRECECIVYGAEKQGGVIS